jgi:DNA-binding Lrp family transcriptional regulator
MSEYRKIMNRYPEETSIGKSNVKHTFLDSLDMKILAECVTDGKASYHKIASSLNISPSTAMKRIKRLESLGIIKGYSAIVDHLKLGYDLTVVTEITVSKGKLLEMEREIAKLPGVCAVYDVTGDTDGIVIAKFRTREELSLFTKSLLAMPFVERTNTHVVLTTVKEDFRFPI